MRMRLIKEEDSEEENGKVAFHKLGNNETAE